MGRGALEHIFTKYFSFIPPTVPYVLIIIASIKHCFSIDNTIKFMGHSFEIKLLNSCEFSISCRHDNLYI
jgi:hypothetical protein